MRVHRSIGLAIAVVLCAGSADAGFISGGNLIPNPPSGVGNSADTWVATEPVTSEGTLDTAIFGWSASGGCVTVKIKVFRKNGASLDFIGESGPYPVSNNGPGNQSLTTAALSPALSVQKGDLLGIVGSGGGDCGNPVGIYNNVGTAVRFPGDVKSNISLTGADVRGGFMLSLFAKGTGAVGEDLAGIIPGAGSLHGGAGSNFKTAVQVTNPGSETVFGRIIVHPAGTASVDSDASFSFSIPPGATGTTDDILADLGISGLATIDLRLPAGSTPPVLIARVFNDAGADGTTGFTEELVDPASVAGGVGVSVTGVLIGPSDVSRFRYNLGIRTLDRAVAVTFVVKDVDGNVVHTSNHNYPANYYIQAGASDFLDGFRLEPDDSLVITFSGGGAIIYGANVDNTTNDPSVQFMRYLFAIA